MMKTGFVALAVLIGAVGTANAALQTVDFASPASVDSGDAKVSLKSDGRGGTVVSVTSEKPLSFVTLAWDYPLSASARILGDHWERSYADLGWRPVEATRPLPWYFLVTDGGLTDGVGVKVQPNAFAAWRVDGRRLELRLDLRSCGQPVELKGRSLEAVTIVSRRGLKDEGAFAAGRAFCRVMCPRPRLPKAPVYGINDWYCAYGRQTATNFLSDAAAVLALCEGLENRPFAVVDDGWQRDLLTGAGWGPWGWTRSSGHFGMPMDEFAKRIVALGAKPGLWYRPLMAWPGADARFLMPGRKDVFDPTVPDVRRRIVADMRRFRDWGMKLVKIDYLTNDWSFNWSMRGEGDARRPLDFPVNHAFGWRDSSRTTAEVMKDLYAALREGAGDDVLIIGCNAINHLAAGQFEIQRIGNDTSGRKWVWTRDMGVNTAAFRSLQNGTFFAADPDCVGLAGAGLVPWELNAQWLDLVAHSGLPLFVSWKKSLLDASVSAALRRAFACASRAQPTIEPLDWTTTRFPCRWRTDAGTLGYNWEEKPGRSAEIPAGAKDCPREIRPASELRFRLDAPFSGLVYVGCVREGRTSVDDAEWCWFSVKRGDREYRLRPGWMAGRIETVVFTDIRDSDGEGNACVVKDFKVVDSGSSRTIDTAKFDGVVFDYAAPGRGYGTVRWTLAGERGAKNLPFAFMPDGRKHAYWFDLTKSRKGADAWRGTCDSLDIVRLKCDFPSFCRSLPVENVRFVKGVPDLAPDPVITGAAAKEAIARAGRPLDLEVAVRNLGTRPVTNVRFALEGLPSGVKVLSGLAPEGVLPPSTGMTSVREGPARLANERLYGIRLTDPGAGEFTLKLTLTADGVGPRTATIPVKVLPSLGLAKCAYVPEPKPIRTGRYEIGAFLFPGWTHHTFACIWGNVLGRKPLLGWYDETRPETIDWQIKQMVENGISFVSVDWYWRAGKLSGDDHWVKAFKASRYRKYLKWHLMWANHNPKGSHSVDDQIKVTRHWIENYFNMPEYQRVDGKPVVAIWSAWCYERDLGKGGCKRMLDLSREEAKKAGYPGIHFIMMRYPDGCVSTNFLQSAADCGFDETTTYKYCGGGEKDSRVGADGGVPFGWIADSSYDHYRNLKANSPVPMMPNLSTGYDDRPWRGEQGWFCSNINVKDFRRICAAGKRFADETGVTRLILGPLDEWGEGSIGYPNAELGWGMLEAVRDTFGEKPAAGWPVNCAPEDVGLVCPQLLVRGSDPGA